MGAEVADVHFPDVVAGLTVKDPMRHHLTDAARPGQPVGAEAGGDEEAADFGLAEAELVIRGERLRAIDQPGHRDLVHGRNPPA